MTNPPKKSWQGSDPPPSWQCQDFDESWYRNPSQRTLKQSLARGSLHNPIHWNPRPGIHSKVWPHPIPTGRCGCWNQINHHNQKQGRNPEGEGKLWYYSQGQTRNGKRIFVLVVVVVIVCCCYCFLFVVVFNLLLLLCSCFNTTL